MNIPTENHIQAVRKALMKWHDTYTRDMPWKDTKDPYLIWLSEIILQQTRVAQGRPYYVTISERYPTVDDLASADEDELLKLWQGLGYYSRARNLHSAAKAIVMEHNGIFPQDYESIISLKGVGRYTAAAIASFAYGLPYAVVDGNVKRVIARLMAIEDPIDDRAIEKRIDQLAQAFLDKSDPGTFNQAIMDLGSTVCTPRNPLCDECPIQERCVAHEKGIAYLIPVKGKKVAKSKVFMHYFVLSDETRILMNKRGNDGIWKGLYEPFLDEYDKSRPLTHSRVTSKVEEILGLKPISIKREGPIKHVLTHRQIMAYFYFINVPENDLSGRDGVYSMRELQALPLPRLIEKSFRSQGIL